MEVDDGLLAFGAEEESAVGGAVHEHVFYEDAGAEGGGVEEGGEGIGPGVAPGGLGAPAPGGEGVHDAPGDEGVHDAPGDDAVFEVFQEAAVGRTLARRFDAEAIVDEYLHS